MSALTPPCSAAPSGASAAPREDCVAQMQFELLRQHANAGESFVVLGLRAEEVLADGKG